MTAPAARVFALLGSPVGHSLSPAMHNAAFRVLGLNAVYVALACVPESVAPLMQALARAGGGGNVTIPHKATAATATGDPALMAAEACNTFWGMEGVLHGANTDPDGVIHALQQLGVDGGGCWLVVGTGGAARGVLEAARRMGAALAVRSRSPERASAFLDQAARVGVASCLPAECGVVINATPLGMGLTDPVPLSLADTPKARVLLDLVYARGETPLVRGARTAGLQAADGREVLLGQGAAAFRHWFPHLDPPLEVMRAAVRAGLG